MTISDSEGFWNGEVACSKCSKSTINRVSKLCDDCEKKEAGINSNDPSTKLMGERGTSKMSSAGHYGDCRGMSGQDFIDPETETTGAIAKQLFRDKTDDYDDRYSDLSEQQKEELRQKVNSFNATKVERGDSVICRNIPGELDHELGTNPRCGFCRTHTNYEDLVNRTNVMPSRITSPDESFHEVVMKETNPNPKDIVGSDKVPMGLVPPVTSAYLALGHLEGDLKYGRVNWRESGVRTMIYLDAAKRHIDKFRDGEWADPTTHVPHLANALACLSIIVDAYHSGKLNDDRPKSMESSKVIDKLGEVVKHLKSLHKDVNPIDYFIDGPRQRK